MDKLTRQVEGKRLGYYFMKADAGFWDKLWSEESDKKNWKAAQSGYLGWFEEPFTKYLPKSGKIIEAGCGLGDYVLALTRRGYRVEGVEWSRKAVDMIKQRYPKLKVRVGDVRKLAAADGYYSGYISLGVVEHDKSGPQDYLREAARILKSGGVAFISVPHFNLLRRIKNLFGFYRGKPVGEEFYQYAFTESEIDRLIEKFGFEIVDHFRYDAYKGLKEELPFLRNLLSFLKTSIHRGERVGLPAKKLTIKSNLAKRPRWLKLADRYFGHMTMVICIKK